MFVVLLAAGAAHLVVSMAVVGVLHSLFSHRVPNVKRQPNLGSDWEDVTSAFTVETTAAAAREGKPLMLFLGSSVTYGYPWQERVIFTRLFAQERPNYKVANLSLIGAGMRSLTDFATCALDATHRPEVLVAEIPLVNTTGSVLSDIKYNPRECVHGGDKLFGYWSLVLRRPYGKNWASVLWDEQAHEKPDSDISIARVPASFFADSAAFAAMRPAYESELRRYLNSVSKMANAVYILTSPIYTPGITEAGGDRAAVEYQIELTLRICQEFSRVRCLDTRPFGSQRELFYNLTHLNQRGHRAMADWLLGQVAP